MVPQFYLRYFTSTPNLDDKEKRIWLYDKSQGRSRNDRIGDVAHENFFYDIPAAALAAHAALPPEQQDADILAADVQAMEHALGKTETQLSIWIREFLGYVDAGKFPQGYKLALAAMLTLQLVRTRQAREDATAAVEMQMETVLEKALEARFGEQYKVQFTVEPWRAAIFQLAVLCDRAGLAEMSKPLLLQHSWVVGVNKTPLSFYTSDHPVVMRPLTAQPVRVHFDTPGVEIAFPLTPRHILLLVEKSAIPFADNLDGTIRDIDQTEDVFDYNRLQVRSSRRQVFCDSDEFQVAAELCDAHPEYRDPNRPRAEPITGLRDGVVGTRIVR
jgi:hypothetical protein